jgi:hypothetical protein
MQSPDLSSEITFILSQINSLTEAFDQAIAKDTELRELKKIFHEIRMLRARLDQLDISMPKNSE